MALIKPSSVQEVTLTPVIPARSSRRTVHDSFSKLGATLLMFDILAFFLAAVTAPVATKLFERLAGAPETSLAHHHVYFPLCLVALTMFWSKGVYNRRTPWWSQVQHIGKVIFLIFLIDGFISFGLKIHPSRLLISCSWAFAFIFMVVFRRISCRIAARQQWWKIPTVVIGDNATVTDLVFAFNADPCAGYDVHTALLRDRDHRGFDIGNLPPERRNIKLRNGMEYESYIRENPDNFYVVSLDAFRGDMRDRLISVLDEAGSTYAIVPSITRVGLYEMEPHYFFGHDIMMLHVRAPGTTSFSTSKLIKRVMDIAISGTALIMLAPVFAATAIMLKVEGQGGSVLYGGRRLGYQGRFFRCWKFRSMEPESDHLLHAMLDANPLLKANWEKYRKLPNDPRVTTRTAKLIRKLSIDELPQLWNVLTGDMSLVGPRPILEDEQSYFGDTLKEYFSVRPGLTGLWQVSGRNNASFLRRVYWDSWYVRNWSLWSDIIILIKTPMVLLNQKGVH